MHNFHGRAVQSTYPDICTTYSQRVRNFAWLGQVKHIMLGQSIRLPNNSVNNAGTTDGLSPFIWCCTEVVISLFMTHSSAYSHGYAMANSLFYLCNPGLSTRNSRFYYYYDFEIETFTVNKEVQSTRSVMNMHYH